MRFDPAQIKDEAKRDFETAWQRGIEYVYQPLLDERYPRRRSAYGVPHPIFETIRRLREAYLRLGFVEAMNPLIVEDREVYKQFGGEALAVLDRCFYLAGLPRPDVGISDDRASEVGHILGRDLTQDEVETIRRILHSYKKGQIEGDDLVPAIATGIGAPDAMVSTVLEKVFPEFRELRPEPTRRTLRSHMTSGWFLTLSEMHSRSVLPLRLFSVDRCFRREQAEDATRLMTYHSASCVIMGEDVSIDDGKAVSDGLLSQFGFEKFRFQPDEKRSKYYVPGTQIEVYAYHPELVGSSTKYESGWVELATFGIYSPVALAEYNIPVPVMNLGLGVERLAMMLYNAKDMRYLAYPQFQPDLRLSQKEMVRMIRADKSPTTPAGKKISEAIVKTCLLKGDVESPCQFVAWSGDLYGRRVRVTVVEEEENTKLCGPAYLNEIVVYGDDILGIPHTQKWAKAFLDGVRTGIRFIDAFADHAASDIEAATLFDKPSLTRVRIVRSPGDINLRIDPVLEHYITSNKRKIDIRGPVFTTVISEVEQGNPEDISPIKN